MSDVPAEETEEQRTARETQEALDRGEVVETPAPGEESTNTEVDVEVDSTVTVEEGGITGIGTNVKSNDGAQPHEDPPSAHEDEATSE